MSPLGQRLQIRRPETAVGRRTMLLDGRPPQRAHSAFQWMRFNEWMGQAGGNDLEIRFRQLRSEDLLLLAGWLETPHVTAWWRGDPNVESIEAEYGAVLEGTDPTQVFIVEDAGTPIGLMQRYLLADTPE